MDAKILRGFSVEFRATQDEWQGTHRIVHAATLYGVALVDRPAYTDAQIAERWEQRMRQGDPDNPAIPYYY